MFPHAPALALSEDILLEIFYVLQSAPIVHSIGEVRLRLPIAFILSHVTRQWRGFVINAPLLWANIRVTASLRPDALRLIISRSGNCELDISFLSSPSLSGYTRNRRLRESLHLRDSASLLTPYITRWRRLCIVADPSSMQYIMHSVTNVSFPRLRCLELTLARSHNPSILHFGPLHFNPHVFTTLHLHRVTIHPAHPSHFSGLSNLKLSQTSCRIIDQLHITSLCSVPMIPISTDTPSMSHLTHLTISAPSPALPEVISFTPTNISAVTLCKLRCTTDLHRATLMKLFSVLVTIFLEELVLAGIDDGTWDVFLDFLGAGRRHDNGSAEVVHRKGSKFPALRRLTLKSLAFHGIDQRFAAVFPNIEYLTLVDIDPSPVMALFHHDTIDRFLWPKLKISMNESKIGVPRERCSMTEDY